jgi:hypothetical protein
MMAGNRPFQWRPIVLRAQTGEQGRGRTKILRIPVWRAFPADWRQQSDGFIAAAAALPQPSEACRSSEQSQLFPQRRRLDGPSRAMVNT